MVLCSKCNTQRLVELTAALAMLSHEERALITSAFDKTHAAKPALLAPDAKLWPPPAGKPYYEQATNQGRLVKREPGEWTQAELDYLDTQCSQKVPYTKIAEELAKRRGVWPAWWWTPTAVRIKWHKLLLAPKNHEWTQPMLDHLERKRLGGHTYKALAAELSELGGWPVTALAARDKWHSLRAVRNEAREAHYQKLWAKTEASTTPVKGTGLSPYRPRVPWSPAEDDLLLNLRGRDVPMREIAKKLGRTLEACSARQTTLRKRLDKA